tara:strand:+ start:182 stop:358 length:177 start_codon:yes stop_codon:yes gene_type:complete
MPANIVMECLKPACECIILVKYEGEREKDLDVFCEEIADVMKCPDCKESYFVVGFQRV